MAAIILRRLSKIRLAANNAKDKNGSERRRIMFWISRKRSSKKEDGKFHSKHVNHDPQSESARAVFGLKKSSNSER